VTRNQQDNWIVGAISAAVISLFVAVVAVGFALRSDDSGSTKVAASAGKASQVEVKLSEFKISPQMIDVTAGSVLKVSNTGSTPHNLAVQGTQLKTPMIDPGGSANLDLSGLAIGDYTVICEVAGHSTAGMTGMLMLSAGDGGKATAAASTAGTKAMSSEDMDKAMHDRTARFPEKTDGLGAQVLAPKVLADGTKEFDLTTKVVQWEIEAGKKVEAWTYNGTVPGPTIKVNPGDKVKVVVHNELPESTAVHFHGIQVPNSQDGVPDITQDPIKPNGDFTYEFTAANRPEVGMYHSHHDAAKQVANGLAGAFIVGTEPLPAGTGTISQEIPMMLNDSGTIGFSLNGKSFPATTPISAKLGDWVEIHYMNEGVMAHPMHLHGLDQLVIAKDGFPLTSPYKADTVNVAPGERYTVLVHADQPGVWAFHCHILPHAEKEDGMFGMVTAMIVK
jgi:FtsP/CotA-like multicopper oxidase with cupredoxin domain